MNIFRKTIFTGFAPNQTKKNLRSALQFLLFPWKWRQWKHGGNLEKVERWLESFFSIKHAVCFDSGRSALASALRSLDVGPGYEVLVQAYTCVVVVNAIRSTGATPIFVDVKDHFFMDDTDAIKKITPRTKAMIIQHTFGIPADLDALLAVAKKHHLSVIEDCAHVLGATYRDQKLGTLGDVGMLSFGSDKFVSCVRGGAVITNNTNLFERISAIQQELPHQTYRNIFQHLMYFPVFAIGKSLYHLGIGKLILWFAKQMHLISTVISTSEKQKGEMQASFPARLPNALASILLEQFDTIDTVTTHRKKISGFYGPALASLSATYQTPNETRSWVDYAHLRYPIIVQDPKKLLQSAKKEGIILGDWYNDVLAPCCKSAAHTSYKKGSCTHAEQTSQGSVNLPTDLCIDNDCAAYIIDFLKRYARSKVH